MQAKNKDNDDRFHRYMINIHYNGNGKVYSSLVSAEAYAELISVLFPCENVASEAVSSQSQILKPTSYGVDKMSNLNTKAIELNKVIPFGLSVITKYSNGKIIAKLTHGDNIKTIVKVSYDCSLNTNEMHLLAALTLLEKVKDEHDKEFNIVASSYNEKDNGYSFLTQRV